MSVNRLIYSVLFCHFIAAMAALGMPLFLPYVLPTLSGHTLNDHSGIEWAGVLFILPTLCTALAARFWGHFADRHGRRLSLLRAQLGLACGFLLCGMADSVTTFIVGLMVQGTFGGAMAASNGYLATQIKERALLAKTLNKTQLSARLALVVAPISLGGILVYIRPLDAYLYLTVLPLIALVITLMLPNDTAKAITNSPQPLSSMPKIPAKRCAKEQTKPPLQPTSLWPLYVLQLLFAFSMVITFPYFSVFAHSHGFTSQIWIGLLYALPHMVYLLIAGQAHQLKQASKQTITLGFATLSLACLLHLVPSVTVFVFARVLFGLAMVFCFQGLHKALAESFDANASGKVFSTFDAMAKWGGVLAGLSAAYVASHDTMTSIFILATSASGAALVLSQARLQMSSPQPVKAKQTDTPHTTISPSSGKGASTR